jgi:hypothetical protein
MAKRTKRNRSKTKAKVSKKNTQAGKKSAARLFTVPIALNPAS